MTEFDFDKKYTYNKKIKSVEFGDEEGYEGMLETFGEDLTQVLKIAKKHPMKVWTMIDGEDGMYLVQGYHLVNRIYYVITNEDAETEDEQYLFDSYNDDEEW